MSAYKSFSSYFFSSPENLISFGGVVKQSTTNDVELTYLGRANKSNCSIPKLPEEISDHSTILSQIGIVSCGGWTKYTKETNKCWKLEKNNTWSPFPSMIETRTEFSMEELDNKLVVVGGDFNFTSWTNSMEILDLNGEMKWTKRILEFSALESCMVKVNTTHLLITGGRHLQQVKKVFSTNHYSY